MIATIVVAFVQGGAFAFDLLVAPNEATRSFATVVWYFVYLWAPYAAWVVFFLTLLSLMWLTYRLARNLHMLAPSKFAMSPTYAVGYYIVPIANIFMPPRITGSIARDTFAAAGEARSLNGAIGWWWVTYLLTALLGYVATIVAADSGAFNPDLAFDSSKYESSLLINLAATTTTIVSCYFMLRVFEPLARAQSTLVESWRAQNPA